MTATHDLVPVDRVEVTVLMDNYLDVLMAGAEDVRRFALARDWTSRAKPLAEHGYSALVTVYRDGAPSSILYDAGLTPEGIARNLDVLDVRPADLRAIVISHGHFDHHGGLEGLVRRFGRQRLPLIIHPDAWAQRRVLLPTGAEILLPPPSMSDLEREGLQVIEDRGPTLLIDGAVLVSGQVERVTEFETGMAVHQRHTDAGWVPDPLIPDDQNVIVNVRDRGLVIVSGCSHAGAVNVVYGAKRLTGQDLVAGFIGGLHLTGGLFEPIIGPTVHALAEAGVQRIVPGHCSGWKAQYAIARDMPDAFVQSAVGTTISF
jgi:7,8-dihydropterin-6-yl-methyl-4-(beta-D-ribofuranosyl)aminobenzene 5'-phosphate synthase